MLRMWISAAVLSIAWSALTPAQVTPHEQDEATRVSELVAGNNAFAFDLFARLAHEGKQENMVVSPYSISLALGMTYAGAAGRTASEMEKVLHVSMSPEEVHRAFASLMAGAKVAAGPKRHEVHVANALWGQRGFPFRQGFLDLTRERYGTEARELDFAADPDHARKTINAWIEDQTQRKIINLLQPGTVTPTTVLVLTNAVYLKGNWKTPFSEKQTRKDLFRPSAGRAIPIRMMHLVDRFRYLEEDDVQLLELPVGNGGVSFLILLPRTNEVLAEVQKTLTLKRLEELRTRMVMTGVKVELPRFKIESQFDLTKPLADLGMPSAFRPDADFSRMTTRAGLAISAVAHKAFLDVQEKGLEAAAATAVVFEKSLPPQPTAAFRADRPFLYFIRDNSSGSLLFLGSLANPRAE